MRNTRALSIPLVVAVSLIATATESLAQTIDGQNALPATPIPLAAETIIPSSSVSTGNPSALAERMAAVQQWMREFTEWQEWEDRWRGKMEPGFLSPRERRIKPDPPVWLIDECRDLADADDARTEPCRLVAEWHDGAAAQARATLLAGRTEEDRKTTWWRHVHIDGLWLTPSTSASYGVVGVHVTLTLVGRWQIFIAPGAMLLNVPTSERTRAWQPATDLGFSYRLIDLTLPGGRQGTLHVNLARAWVLGGSESVINSTVDLVGLSLTFK
jgi:hypothetical protein